MGLEYVDIFYSHRPDPDTPLEETMRALDFIVRSGRALYAGISNYRPAQTREAVRLLAEMGTPCLIHQPSYNMFNRWIEGGLLDVLKEEQVGCIVFSPLAQGILTDRYIAGIPEDSRAAKPQGFLKREQVTDQKMDKVRRLSQIARQRGQSMAQLAISWVLRHESVTSALIGASSVAQLVDSVGTINNLALNPEELAAIEAILLDASM
jgi:L-glyceraldehyde 3-phosphate reductase